MRKFGLLGYPLGHSISDYIHSRIFEVCGLADCEYDLYEVNPDELSFKGDSIRELNGFNVTIPYKTAIIPYLDRLDASASGYGAVNCVKFHEEFEDGSGKCEHVGYNTDGYGFLKSIEMLGASLNSKVLLLGCGGTGRMMAVEAIKAGADLTVAIRRNPEEEKAAAKLSGEINEITGKFITKTFKIGQTAPIGPIAKMRITYADSLNVVNNYDLLLNATPCGMYPNVDEMPIEQGILSKVKYLFDAIYNPSPTKLISVAQKHGAKTLGGMAMLVYQAALAQIIWNDIKIKDSDVEKIIEECSQQL